MAALIEYVCTAKHDRREEPSVTLEQGSWAYCSCGAISGHQWTRIDPTAIEALRSPVRKGHTPSVQGESVDPSKIHRS
jgi:hypothetical protein